MDPTRPAVKRANAIPRAFADLATVRLIFDEVSQGSRIVLETADPQHRLIDARSACPENVRRGRVREISHERQTEAAGFQKGGVRCKRKRIDIDVGALVERSRIAALT